MAPDGADELCGTGTGGIGQRVRAVRGRLDWTREALAYHAGLSWSAIAQIENGRRTNLRQGTLVSLADALGVSIDYLVSGRAPSRPMLEHQALLYEGGEEFVATVVPFLAAAMDHGEAALAVTSKANLRRLRRELGDHAGRVRLAENTAWYRTPTHALHRYQSFVTESVDAGAHWVRIVGEPVWGRRTGDAMRVWARYEAWLNLAFGGAPLTLICPYDAGTVAAEVLELARYTHPATREGTSLRPSPAYHGPAEVILDLE